MTFLSFGRHWQYLKYVMIHKYWVFLAGWELGIPWLALIHDLSKFMPDEWRWYARHFYAPDGSKQTWQGKDGFYVDLKNDIKFEQAWQRHIRRNKHHPQYWVIIQSADCECIPLHAMKPRFDVLLKDGKLARCMTCLTIMPMSLVVHEVLEMPLRYRLEMLADWTGAGMAQGTPDTLAWYGARGHRLPFGPETRAWVEEKLGYESIRA